MPKNTEVDKAVKQSAMALLDDLASELDQGHLEETVEVHGVHWTMRLLEDHETNWANGYQRTNSTLALISSRRAPTLAIGIRSIGKMNADGKLELKPVKQYFIDAWVEAQGELDEATKSILNNANEYIQQYWFAEQLFHWLSKRPSAFVQALWTKWQALEERRDKVEEAMGKSSTEDGTSKVTSTILSSEPSVQTQA
jgi:hypothetical protein